MIRTRPEPVLLTIVILAHNKSSLTRDCLDALSRVTADIEVILVDNASTDDTPAVARAFTRQLPGLRVERFARNLAYAAANNRAVRRAAGDTLLFLNNDVVVAPEAPQRLVAAVAASGGGIVGPKLLFPGSRTVQHAGMRQMLWGYASNFGTGGAPGEAMLNQGGPIFAVTGAMLSIGRRLFERLGGFDERFRWGYEDVDLCLKARQAGAAVSYAPEIESVHAESATLSASRRPVDLAANYGLYRRRWNHVLVPGERAAVARLGRERVRRVAVFGTGLAARGLHRMLARNRISVVGFTASAAGHGRFCGRPVAPLEETREWRFDRLIVATQHYFPLRERLAVYDPKNEPIFPIVD